ncbi:trypsin-like serine protease [Vibrio hepatarius]|uniref:trypsin-like serine protease n=1 Tax=Vibrio hepatarius TaxID=171383 RepID=UPI001C0A63C3|nr:trypsin-like serine protease [Vibrio hepatarius]MBU2896769.1 trypsin-like serine protease [Vibrio hepatarius]
MPFAPAQAIVNGELAEPDEFPWVAKLIADSNGICTGSLIREDMILTAAHCLTGIKDTPEKLKISFPNTSGHNTVYTASDVFIHPSYGDGAMTGIFEEERTFDGETSSATGGQGYQSHDIGLVKLQKAVPDISPASLTTHNKESRSFYSLGYGSVGDRDIDEDKEKSLLTPLSKIDIKLVSPSACKLHSDSTYQAHKTDESLQKGVPSTMVSKDVICTIAVQPFSSACNGDSGSPLIQTTNGKHEIVGIASFAGGSVCAHETNYEYAPTVYSSSEQYNYFISSILSGDTNLDKHKNLIENPFNEKLDGEGWTFNDKSNFYTLSSDKGYFNWGNMHRLATGLIVAKHLSNPNPASADKIPENVKAFLEKYPNLDFLGADFKDIIKVGTFFATSYLPAERHQTVDLVASTGLSAPELAQVKPSLIVSEIFTRTYCGGDRYFMKATILDEQKQSLETYSTGDRYLEGECNWDTDWYEARLDIPYVEGARYIRFEDGGQDSENWEGFYGPRMTAASVRLNTPFIVK